MQTLTVCLPADLAQAVAHEVALAGLAPDCAKAGTRIEKLVAHEAALAGLAPAEVGLQALREYCQRRVQVRALALYVEEAARGYAKTALREEAVATAEEAVVPGNEALGRAEAVPPSETDGAWWC